MKDIILKYLLLFSCVGSGLLTAQCPGAENCHDAYVFCSLDAMNGFSCNTPSTTRGTCWPSCGAGPFVYRWCWAFVSQGGNATITLSVGTCIQTGLYSGIFLTVWDNCCGKDVYCNPHYSPPNSTYTYQLVNLKPCKLYYISFDHGDDNCDFTISTSGGGPPYFKSFGFY